MRARTFASVYVCMHFVGGVCGCTCVCVFQDTYIVALAQNINIYVIVNVIVNVIDNDGYKRNR